jgi:hypothetical protein
MGNVLLSRSGPGLSHNARTSEAPLIAAQASVPARRERYNKRAPANQPRRTRKRFVRLSSVGVPGLRNFAKENLVRTVGDV